MKFSECEFRNLMNMLCSFKDLKMSQAWFEAWLDENYAPEIWNEAWQECCYKYDIDEDEADEA